MEVKNEKNNRDISHSTSTKGGSVYDGSKRKERKDKHMELKRLVHKWFDKWKEGDFLHLPISEYFKHTSPFGTISGKKQYIRMVEANKDKFLGYRFEIHDELYNKDRACVRYTATQGDFILDVSEWYFVKKNLIDSIVSYYHIGEIRDERKLSDPQSYE
jgi:hypothetical protein